MIADHVPLRLDAADRTTLYRVACALHQGGEHADAEKFFGALCLAEPSEPRGWMGLGASRQRRGDYGGAVPAYGRAFAAGADPWAPLHAAECLAALGDRDAARAALDDARDFAAGGERPDELARRAAALRAALARRPM